MFCRRRWGHGRTTFLPHRRCAAPHPVTSGIDASCFPTSVSNHNTKVGRNFLRFFIYYDFIKNSAGVVSPVCFTVILGMGENEISASLSPSGSTARQVVCTCWNSPSLFMFARSLWVWATWGMIGSERRILIKLFHHSVGTFLFLLSNTFLRRPILSLERPSSVTSKENWRTKGCF